jgi:GT2 family glycosyltransferase
LQKKQEMTCDISIITVNYNGLEDTCALIDSIPFNDRMEVIVVDNGSKTNEAALISQHYPYVITIRSEQNLGFAGGNNLGIKAARGKYLYLINNDTIFRGEDFQALIDRLNTSDKIGMVCPKILFAWGNNPIQFAGYTPLSAITMRNRAIGFGEEDKGQYNTPHPTPYAHGAAMMVSRKALERVGMLPECYFLYYEELDWSMMFRRAGYEIWYEPSSTIYHKESRSTGQDSPLRTYYLTRNRLLFVKRNVKGVKKYASYIYLIIIVGLRDMLKHIFKGRTDLLNATYRGVRDFLNSQFSILNFQYK